MWPRKHEKALRPQGTARCFYFICFAFLSVLLLRFLPSWLYGAFGALILEMKTETQPTPVRAPYLVTSYSLTIPMYSILLGSYSTEGNKRQKSCWKLVYLISSLSSEMSQPAVSTEWLKKSQESTKEHLSVLDATWFPDKDASSDYSK